MLLAVILAETTISPETGIGGALVLAGVTALGAAWRRGDVVAKPIAETIAAQHNALEKYAELVDKSMTMHEDTVREIAPQLARLSDAMERQGAITERLMDHLLQTDRRRRGPLQAGDGQ